MCRTLLLEAKVMTGSTKIIGIRPLFTVKCHKMTARVCHTLHLLKTTFELRLHVSDGY